MCDTRAPGTCPPMVGGPARFDPGSVCRKSRNAASACVCCQVATRRWRISGAIRARAKAAKFAKKLPRRCPARDWRCSGGPKRLNHLGFSTQSNRFFTDGWECLPEDGYSLSRRCRVSRVNVPPGDEAMNRATVFRIIGLAFLAFAALSIYQGESNWGAAAG